MDIRQCPTCGYANPADAPACQRCKARLREEPTSPTTVNPPQGDPTLLRPGQVLAKRYHIVDLIGRGGMGAIYRVQDRVLREGVALKTLLPQFVQDKTIVGRFFNEARIARQLSHPNIVRVHDIGMADGVMYISMEYVEGRSMRAWMDQAPGKRLSIRHVIEIMLQLCAALEYAHRYTVHRDIKPENVMIGSDGTIKLMDFGISKLMAHTRMTMTSMVMGTPQYMSPEQFRDSGSVDSRADIYSLGILMYESITGSLPTGLSKPLSKAVTGAPPQLDAVVARCLEPEPDSRYQSASELAEALREVLAIVLSPQDDSSAREPRGLPIGRILGIAMAALIVAGAGYLAWVLVTGVPASTHADRPPSTTETHEQEQPGHEPVSPRTSNQSSEAVLLERAMALAEAADKPFPAQQALLAKAGELQQTAEDKATPADEAQLAQRQALQCALGVLLWPKDDHMAFVPPGEAILGEGASRTRITVDGFFMDRIEANNAAFRLFASATQWPLTMHMTQENPMAPVHGMPFYYAQAFAAFYQSFDANYSQCFSAWAELPERQGKKLPSEPQWTRAAKAIETGEITGISGLDMGVTEFTRTRYTEPPLKETDQLDDPAGLDFGSEVVVRGNGETPSAALKSRKAQPYHLGTPGLGFRCVKELPRNLSSIARILEALESNAV